MHTLGTWLITDLTSKSELDSNHKIDWYNESVCSVYLCGKIVIDEN